MAIAAADRGDSGRSASAKRGASAVGFGVEARPRAAPLAISRASARIDVALHVERRQRLPCGRGQHRLVDHARLDRRPDREEQQRRQRRPQRDVEAVIDRAAIEPRRPPPRRPPRAAIARTSRRRRRSPGRRRARWSGSWRSPPSCLLQARRVERRQRRRLRAGRGRHRRRRTAPARACSSDPPLPHALA